MRATRKHSPVFPKFESYTPSFRGEAVRPRARNPVITDGGLLDSGLAASRRPGMTNSMFAAYLVGHGAPAASHCFRNSTCCSDEIDVLIQRQFADAFAGGGKDGIGECRG